jgi:hypothetical protein
MAHHRATRDDDWTPPTFGMGVVIGVLGGLVVAALISAVVTLPWTYLG